MVVFLERIEELIEHGILKQLPEDPYGGDFIWIIQVTFEQPVNLHLGSINSECAFD